MIYNYYLDKAYTYTYDVCLLFETFWFLRFHENDTYTKGRVVSINDLLPFSSIFIVKPKIIFLEYPYILRHVPCE